MTNKHIILEHLAKSKGLIRKDLVTFICINNGYDGHKQGYYGTAIQEWEREGYIKKVGNKWYIDNLGKTYLKTPKIATLKASLNKMTKGRDSWKDSYYELKDEMLEYKEKMRYIKDELLEYAEEVKNANLRCDELKDASASTIQSLREANFDADNSDEVAELEAKLSTSKNNESLMETEVKRLEFELGECERKRDIERTSYHMADKKIALAELNIKELEIERSSNTTTLPYDKSLIILALETLREQCSDDNNQGQVDRINGEISEIKGCSRNTLTLQPPPSTELGDFSKAELIKIIKGML
tara:strand:- start:1563 stop:2462 length:900 start_codon:yes stop_codon:yes gene_type:complete